MKGHLVLLVIFLAACGGWHTFVKTPPAPPAVATAEATPSAPADLKNLPLQVEPAHTPPGVANDNSLLSPSGTTDDPLPQIPRPAFDTGTNAAPANLFDKLQRQKQDPSPPHPEYLRN